MTRSTLKDVRFDYQRVRNDRTSSSKVDDFHANCKRLCNFLSFLS